MKSGNFLQNMDIDVVRIDEILISEDEKMHIFVIYIHICIYICIYIVYMSQR